MERKVTNVFRKNNVEHLVVVYKKKATHVTFLINIIGKFIIEQTLTIADRCKQSRCPFQPHRTESNTSDLVKDQ